jgi:Ca-activated chloride channel family protein
MGPAIKAIFGARRIINIEHMMVSRMAQVRDEVLRLGIDPAEVFGSATEASKKIYPENAWGDEKAALRDLLVREALAFGLASSETAFLATRTEPGPVAETQVAVANAMPAGWSEPLLVGSSMAPPSPSAGRGGYGGSSSQSSASGGYGGVAGRVDKFNSKFAGNYGRVRSRKDLASSLQAVSSEPSLTVVFTGLPVVVNGDAVLFDSASVGGTHVLPDQITLKRLFLRFLGQPPRPEDLDSELAILIFIDDVISPRARVPLVDLLRHHGERPLNLSKGPAQVVRIVLTDPAGALAREPLLIELNLGW